MYLPLVNCNVCSDMNYYGWNGDCIEESEWLGRKSFIRLLPPTQSVISICATLYEVSVDSWVGRRRRSLFRIDWMDYCGWEFIRGGRNLCNTTEHRTFYGILNISLAGWMGGWGCVYQNRMKLRLFVSQTIAANAMLSVHRVTMMSYGFSFLFPFHSSSHSDLFVLFWRFVLMVVLLHSQSVDQRQWIYFTPSIDGCVYVTDCDGFLSVPSVILIAINVTQM